MVAIERTHRGEELGKNLVGSDVPSDHIPVVLEDAAPVLAQLTVVVVGGFDNLFGYALSVFAGSVARIQLVEGEFALKIDQICGVAVFARKFEKVFMLRSSTFILSINTVLPCRIFSSTQSFTRRIAFDSALVFCDRANAG